MPASGHVARLVAVHCEDAGDRGMRFLLLEFIGLVDLVLIGKDFGLNRKTPAHLVGLVIRSRPRVWKRLRHVDFSGISMPDHTRRRCDHAYGLLSCCL